MPLVNLHPTPTILAIDDSRSLCAFYRVVLSRFGKVRTVNSLEDADRHMAHADLIILGLHLVENAGAIPAVVARMKAIAPVLLSEDCVSGDNSNLIASLGVAGRWQRGNDHEQLCWQVRRIFGDDGTALPAVPRLNPQKQP